MIDFHSHILPNIDDGSRSIEETFNLIKEAKEAGFEGIVLTSHYIEDYYETNVPERDLWVDAISENLRNKGIDTDIYLGNEIYMSDNMLQLLKDGKASTINNTCYVLFEMPLNSEPMNLYSVIYSLQENKLIPVLAHPERYSFVQKEPELINDLIEKGVLMQANYGSILGNYGKKAECIVKKLLENDMIHFLGSDVHRQNTIYKQIPEALEKIKEIVGEEKLYELSTQNPTLALKNKRIEINREPEEIVLTFKEKLMMYLKR
jgi:protein-tyrosine phosphatase